MPVAGQRPPRGERPALAWIEPAALTVDATYQRSIETKRSQHLIAGIARLWDWSLCQPLVVVERDHTRYIVDGQHRWAAAVKRGDIDALPCVVVGGKDGVGIGGTGAEARLFVALNGDRRPLSALDLFHAAVAGGDETAVLVQQLVEDAGLAVARTTNNQSSKSVVANVNALKSAVAKHGDVVVGAALAVVARAWPDSVLQYHGTIWPGVLAAVVEELNPNGFDDPDDRRLWIDSELGSAFVAVCAEDSQAGWYQAIYRHASSHGVSARAAAVAVFGSAWNECLTEMFADD